MWANFSRPKQKGERAYKGDITGRRVRTKNFQSKRPDVIVVPRSSARQPTTRNRNVYPSAARRRVISRTSSKQNIYPQSARFVNNNSKKPKRSANVVSNADAISRPQSQPGTDPGKKRIVRPRSASRPFMRRRSINPWANFKRRKRKSEQAVTTDIAGRPLRTKNFRTPPREVIPQGNPYARRRDVDRAGTPKGRRLSATSSGKAWQGDVARRKILGGRVGRLFDFRRDSRKGGYVSATGKGKNNERVPVRPPGMGGWGLERYRGFQKSRRGLSDQGEGFTGFIKARRRAKGGGSISGKLWNNQGVPTGARTPGIGARGIGDYKGNIRSRRGFNNQGEEFSGSLKARRPVKGGGSVSGKLWNNQGQPTGARTPGIGARGIGDYKGNIRGRRIFNDQGEEFTGMIRARRPVKGGGSVSGKLWNNNQSPVPVRTPGVGSRGIGKFQGNIRGRKSFSNQGEEYSGNLRMPARSFNNQGEEFTGYIRSRKPLKGGGSVSGKLWNNNETPIPSRSPSKGAMKAGGFPGKIKMHQLKPGFNNQGEEFTGYIKARRPQKGGGSISGKLWNNNEQPIAVRVPKSEQGGEFRGNLRVRRGYERNPNAHEDALKSRKAKTTDLVDGLQIKVKQHPYGRRNGAPEGSLPGLKPTKESVRASEFARGMKQYRYVRNSSSSRDALRVREPGKAFARATDYQGNIKLKKYELFGRRDRHPDAQFVKTNKNNVDSERDMFTNFKLWWARLFKKNETQPGHLKDKGHKPRYDKGEQGLWND